MANLQSANNLSDVADVTASRANLRIPKNVLDFGADPTGVSDSTSAIAAAIAATASGGSLYFPTGAYLVLGAGSSVFNYAKAITLYGDGAGSIILVSATMPTTRDIFHINPTTAILGGGFRNIQIAPVGGTPGRHAIHVDTTADSDVSYSFFEMDNVFISQTGGGHALFLEGRFDSPGGGAVFCTFTNNGFQGGVQIDYGGDSLLFSHNSIGGVGVGIEAGLVAGAGNLVIDKNTISVHGQEAIIIHAGVKPVISNNEIEHSTSGALTGSGVVNLLGDIATILNPTIHNNQIQVTAGSLDPNPIYIGAASDTQISLNRVNAWNGAAQVVNSASALRTTIAPDNVWVNQTTVGNLSIADNGSSISYVPRASTYGSTTTVLHGSSSGTGAFAAVSLTADVSDILPVANGGTGDAGTAWTSYTPIVTATAGSFAAVSATGNYKQIGRTTFVRMQITATSVGTAAGRMLVTLPVNAAAGVAGSFSGMSNANFKQINGAAGYDAAGKVTCILYDGTFPAVASTIFLAGFYEAA